MYEYLVIRLRDGGVSSAAVVEWMFVSLQGESSEPRHDALQDVGERYGMLTRKPLVVVLAPAREVLLTAAEVPLGQHRYAKQAMPFLVEEKLADDIEDVHIAIGPVVKTEPVPAAVVRHFDVINWLDALYSVGLPTTWLVPEQLAVPWQSGRIRVQLDVGGALVRDGEWHAAGCDLDNTALVASLMARHRRTEIGVLPPKIDIAYAAGGEMEPVAQALRSELGARLDNEINLLAYAESTLEVLARNQVANLGDAINLLQGGYGAKIPGRSGGFNLKRVGATFAACVGLHLAVTLGAGMWFDWRADSIREDSRSLYAQWFPQAQRVFNPRRQLQSKLANSDGAGSDVLLAYIGAVADTWPRGDSDVQLQSMDYVGQTGSMTLQLESAAADNMAQLRKNLQARGLRTALKSVSQRGERVTGRLELGGTP
jgi:general secretion pathway protein L